MSDVQPGDAQGVSDAVTSALPFLKLRADEVGWEALRERDLQKALERSTGAKQTTVGLERWPSVGAVDRTGGPHCP